MQGSRTSQNPLRHAFRYFRDYLRNTPKRSRVILQLTGLLASTVFSVALFLLGTWLFEGMFAAMIALNAALFVQQMCLLGLVIAVAVAVNAVREYLTELFSRDWRIHLTQKYVTRYFDCENNYLELSRLAKNIDSPGQRIQMSIKVFTLKTVKQVSELLHSSLHLIASLVALGIVGGSLPIVIFGAQFVIPGYLVWVALISAAITSIGAYYAGKTLNKTIEKEVSLEADYRANLDLISSKAESIAMEKGVPYFKNKLTNKIQDIAAVRLKKIWQVTKVGIVKFLSISINFILPVILSAPAYFAGLITISQITQISMLFRQIFFSLAWFATSFPELKEAEGNLGRVVEFEDILNQGRLSKQEQLNFCSLKDLETIQLDLEHLAHPSELIDEHIVENLKLTLRKGENTLLKAPSGFGKSTMFKVIGKSWSYGRGEVIAPQSNEICLLPQRPTIDSDVLKRELAYPASDTEYSDEDYTRVLTQVGLAFLIPELNQRSEWSIRLSLGQQQRLAAARALLKRPTWLLLDECTSSLDEASEEAIYRLLQKELKDTTIISIAHRSSVNRFHSRVIELDKIKQEKVVPISAKSRFFSRDDDVSPATTITPTVKAAV